MKFPKEWFNELGDWFVAYDPGCNNEQHRKWVEKTLTALHDIGALKDPPKPRMWLICCNHFSTDTDADAPNSCCKARVSGTCEWIKVREVIE